METFLIKAAQLILALAILIIIHEFGHFLFARIFGIKVEKFYIFFDPLTELFKWKPRRYIGGFGKSRRLKNADAEDALQSAAETDPAPGTEETPEQRKKRTKGRFWKDTEYGIGWIPLGGYCKISGMIDESMDTEQMKQPVKSWEFRAKPAWQRLLVMIAGVLFNFLTAIIIYAGIVYATGEKYVPVNKASLGMAYSPEAHKVGFRDGDIPLSADGEELISPAEARMQMIQAKSVRVLRDGDTISIAIPKDFIFRLDEEAKSDSVDISFFTYRLPVVITQVMPGEGAARGGVKKGDRILMVDSVEASTIDRFFPALEGHQGKTIALTVARAGAYGTPADTLTLNVPLNDASKMGVGLETDMSNMFPTITKTYNIFQSVPRGIEMGTDRLVSYARSMKLVFTKEGAKSVGGFGTIGSIFPESWDWIAFWDIAAFLAVALAFMNILPIPALDGGHVIFLLWEMITGKPASQKVMEWTTTAGMVLLIALLLYANGMDIVRFFGK